MVVNRNLKKIGVIWGYSPGFSNFQVVTLYMKWKGTFQEVLVVCKSADTPTRGLITTHANFKWYNTSKLSENGFFKSMIMRSPLGKGVEAILHITTHS